MQLKKDLKPGVKRRKTGHICATMDNQHVQGHLAITETQRLQTGAFAWPNFTWWNPPQWFLPLASIAWHAFPSSIAFIPPWDMCTDPGYSLRLNSHTSGRGKLHVKSSHCFSNEYALAKYHSDWSYRVLDSSAGNTGSDLRGHCPCCYHTGNLHDVQRRQVHSETFPGYSSADPGLLDLPSW